MNVRRGLGRGLGALIPPVPAEDLEPRSVHADEAATASDTPEAAEAPAEDSGQPDPSAELEAIEGARFAEVPVAAIRPNPRQPRQAFDEEAMAELVHSIQEVGLLQPIVVRDIGGGQYELVMGERRWRAAQTAELEKLPAIVRQTTDDDLLRDALLENLHRAELNPLEEAAAYGQLLDDFGCTHDELAQRIGRSRPQITNMLRLLKLSPSVQRRVAAGVLSAGHARALLGVNAEAEQERLAQRVVAEGLSVRALEEMITVGAEGEEEVKKPRTPRTPTPFAPKVAELESRLGERFETRVKVNLGKNKGKITVEFASIDDLERIVGVMDPQGGSE